jgi:two-component system sensor histidine kinase QseC
MNYSLRQLLLVALLSASMLIWGITAFINYKVTRNEVSSLFDAELAQSAKVLNTFVEGLLVGDSLEDHWNKEKNDSSVLKPAQKKMDLQLYSEDQAFPKQAQNELVLSFEGLKEITQDSPVGKIINEVVKEELPASLKYSRKIAFQLVLNDVKRTRLLHSQNAPEDEEFPKSLNHVSEVRIQGDLWHIYSIISDNGDYIIHVGQKEEIRAQLTDEISSHLVTQFLIGLPFLGIVIWLIVGHALKPINRLERQLSRREASYLKPLSTKKLPNEILPVVNEINNLFVQLERAFEHERRFSADASHELRTPLAGLLTQAQVALRTTDDEVRKQALQRIKQAVNRMTYMVQQLLTFSRIESNVEFLSKDSTILSREVVQVIADLEPEAHKKRIQMEFEEDHEVPVVVNVPLINILIRNIIDNAIKYTPAQGTIMITVSGQENQIQFCVEDSGPGIAPDQYEESLKRFHRCKETVNAAQGSGLGFSIVQRIVAIHGADLVLGVSQFGGLKVTVLFPFPKRVVEKNWQKQLSFFSTRKNH